MSSWLKSKLSTKGLFKKTSKKKLEWLKLATIMAYTISMFVDFVDLTGVGFFASMIVSGIPPVMLFFYDRSIFKNPVVVILQVIDLLPFIGMAPLEPVLIWYIWKN